MRTQRRILSLLLALCLLLTLAPTAQATETPTSGKCGDEINWYLEDDGALILYGSGETYYYSRFNDRPAPWSTFADQITRIRVEGSITALNAALFEDCTSAISISLSRSLERINESAWPASIEYIFTESENANYVAYNGVLYAKNADPMSGDISKGEGSFCLVYYPPAMKASSYTVREETEAILDEAFNRNPYIQTITLNDDLQRINSSAFRGCTALSKIDIPHGVREIEGCAFYGCSALSEVTLPSSLTKLDTAAFWYCDSLDTITVPESVVEFGTEWSPGDGWSDNYGLSRKWIFRGDAPTIKGYALSMANERRGEYNDAVSITNDIYYPENASGWEQVIQQCSDMENMKFYAYTREDNPRPTFSVSYNLNGGNGEIPASQNYEAGTTVIIPSVSPVRDGYTFTGWSDGIVVYQAGQSFIMPEYNVTLKVQWKKNAEETEIPINKDTWVSSSGYFYDKYVTSKTEALSVYQALESRVNSATASRIYDIIFHAQYRPTALGGAYWPYPNSGSQPSKIYDSGLRKTVNKINSKGCAAYARFASLYIYDGTEGNAKFIEKVDDGIMGTTPTKTELKSFISKYATPGERIRFNYWKGNNKNGNLSVHSIVYLIHDADGIYFLDNPGYTTDSATKLKFCSWNKLQNVIRRNNNFTINISDIDNGNGCHITGFWKCPVELSIVYNGEVLSSKGVEGTIYTSYD